MSKQLKTFRALKHLDVSQNELTTLPNWIGDLQNLEIFTANYNAIKELPTSFVNLSKLKILNLEDNALTVLPEQIGLLRNLHQRPSTFPTEHF